ncbi:MAG: molecular chaperone Hsp90 [Selenomonadaceae bacterium]|nr:molecular chaperone Hsp90 [Selenomonadaceae bacterium]
MTKEQIIELAKQMTAAPSCCAPLKAATQAWLAALGTENEKELARKFIEELEGDITDIDNLVAFAHSDIAVKYFGEDGAKKFAAHADELKASGAKFCDCGACKPGLEILKNKALVLD